MKSTTISFIVRIPILFVQMQKGERQAYLSVYFKTEYQGMEGHLVILLCTVCAEAGCGWRTGGVRGHCEQHRPQYTCTVKTVHKVTLSIYKYTC